MKMYVYSNVECLNARRANPCASPSNRYYDLNRSIVSAVQHRLALYTHSYTRSHAHTISVR